MIDMTINKLYKNIINLAVTATRQHNSIVVTVPKMIRSVMDIKHRDICIFTWDCDAKQCVFTVLKHKEAKVNGTKERPDREG